MKYRKLGALGFDVSEIGLGCWQLGDGWGDTIYKNKAFRILEEAVDNGVTFFDTADVYGGGRSEEIIGEFLQSTGARVKVATKFGRMGHVYPDQYTADNLKQGVEDSLKRLGVEVLDVLQLHCIPTEELRKGEIFDHLRSLQKEGKIAHFGASVETVEEGLICLEQEGLCSLQVIYNLFRQKLTADLLPQAESRGVGIIVRLPLASGLLTGKFSKETVFKENDHRNFNRDGQLFNVGETFAGLPFEKGVELAEEIQDRFLPKGWNMPAFALRWILDHPQVSTVIPGASSPSQVTGNAAASELDAIPNEVMENLEEFYREEVASHIRGAY